jgi:hypothetical protein
MLIRNNDENTILVAPKIKVYKFPFRVSIVFQTITNVSTPKRAGKNLIQKIEFPNKNIRNENQDVTGGTDKYPQSK